MRVAVIGSGVAGLVAAHHLHRRHDISVFEADGRPGGHVNTVEVDLPEGPVAVDTGFIVCNDWTYPHFLALLDELGVETVPSEMSFSVTDEESGTEYRASNLSTIYAQRRNLLAPRHHRMLADILRFNRHMARYGRRPDDPAETLGQVVARGRYSPEMVRRFLVPFGSSIWSAEPSAFLDMPAATYARFAANHGLLSLLRRPRWLTIPGGARTYVDALVAPFAHRLRTATPVVKVTRHRTPERDEVELLTAAGPERFDRVVIATHSDQALAMLADPSPAEREILGAIRYQPNEATLHLDQRMLPANRRARASWNFHLGAGSQRAATLTYWMNSLQPLPTDTDVMVTLNRHDRIDPDLVLARIDYSHPVLDTAAVAAQSRLDEIQGRNGIWFAGAWSGYGFHEDGVRSGMRAAAGLEAR